MSLNGISSVIATQPTLAGLLKWCLSELTGPAFYMPMWAWEKVAGSSDFALRLPSLVISLATPLAILRFGNRDADLRLWWTVCVLLWVPIFAEGELPFAPDEVALIGGIVTTRRRAFVARMADRGFAFRTLVHPSAIVSPRARIDAGTFVGAGVIIASHTHVGAHVLLNRGANVGHDNALAPFVTIGPGAILAGAVRVGAGSYVAVGAVVRDHLEIGAGAVVAAGAVVVKPVEAHALVAGVPATVVKNGVDGL